MSITFSVESESISFLPCNVCGGSESNPIENFCENDIPEADAPCYGMGFRFSGICLNLSTETAFHLLQALNLDCETSGRISGENLLINLATIEAANHTKQVEIGYKITENGVGPARVIYSGITESQMERYINKLTELANRAISQDKMVIWC